MSDNGKYESRIRKLLAIAEDSAASDSERASALAQAARIAAQHDLEMDECRVDPEYGTTELGRWTTVPPWCDGILAVLNDFFHVKCLRVRLQNALTGERWGSAVEVFGSRASREVAVYVFVVLRREFLRLANQWKKRIRRRVTAPEMRGYCMSLAIGLAERLKSEQQAMNAEFGLIRVVDLSDRMKQVCGDMDKAKPRARKLTSEGYEAGKQIQILPALRGEMESPVLDHQLYLGGGV